MTDSIVYPRAGRKAFQALLDCGIYFRHVSSKGSYEWGRPDGGSACAVTSSGALYVNAAMADVAISADPHPTRILDNGAVAYLVGESRPGVGGGGRRSEPPAGTVCGACGLRAPADHDGRCELCGAELYRPRAAATPSTGM